MVDGQAGPSVRYLMSRSGVQDWEIYFFSISHKLYIHRSLTADI